MTGQKSCSSVRSGIRRRVVTGPNNSPTIVSIIKREGQRNSNGAEFLRRKFNDWGDWIVISRKRNFVDIRTARAEDSQPDSKVLRNELNILPQTAATIRNWVSAFCVIVMTLTYYPEKPYPLCLIYSLQHKVDFSPLELPLQILHQCTQYRVSLSLQYFFK
jgi:hypothetical protein